MTFAVVDEALAAIPRLRDPGLSETEVTTLLRRRAAGWITLSFSERTLVDAHYWLHDIDTLYRQFRRLDAGVFCGGAAWTLMRLFNAFGFESWTYNYGADSNVSHVVTLVRADGKIIVHDAYTNHLLVDANGDPIDARELLGALARRGGQEIDREEGSPVPLRNVLYETDELAEVRARGAPTWPAGDARNLASCTSLTSSVALCRIAGVGFSRLRYWVYWDKALDVVEAAGFPRDFLYLMLFPLGLSSDADGWTPPSDTRDTPTRALLATMLRAMEGSPSECRTVRPAS